MAASESKGAALERRVARAEFAEGAVVALRYPVRVPDSDQAHSISDVDVLSVDIDHRLRTSLSIFECKSVRGQKAEADRLLALAGLKKYVGSDRAALVRETATGRGRSIARKLGVEIMDTKQLEDRERSHQWVPKSFGPVAGEKWDEVHLEVSRTLKTIGDFPFSLFGFLRFDALISQPHTILGSLMTLQEFLARGTVLPRRVEGTVMSNALLALVMAGVRTAGRLDALGPQQARQLIENGVVTGNPYDDSLLRVAGLADALMQDQVERVHRAYTSKGAKRQPFALASVRDAISIAPTWLDRFMDFSVRLRARSPIARELPQVVQLVCFDALMGDENWKAPAFDHLFTLEHKQLLNIGLDTLGTIVGSDLTVFGRVRSIDFERSGTVRDRAAEYVVPERSPRRTSADQQDLFDPDR